MKKRILFFLCCILCMVAFPSSAESAAPEYHTQGDLLTASELQKYYDFNAIYKENIQYLSSLQQQQLSSQYGSTVSSLQMLDKVLDADLPETAKTDYNNLGHALQHAQIMLPLLYSQLYTSKTMYLEQKFDIILHTVVPVLLAEQPASARQQFMDTAQILQAAYTAIAIDQKKLADEYLLFSDGTMSHARAIVLFRQMQIQQAEILTNISAFENNYSSLL